MKYIEFTDGILSGRYDSDIHGPRTLLVADPAFDHPQIEIQNDHYDPDTSMDGPTIFIDDPAVEVPLVEVANPDCKIPSAAIEVSEELFRKTIDEQDGIWSLVDGEIVKVPRPPLSITALKARQLRLINSDFEQAMQQITTGYPKSEIDSWSKQEAEAREFLTGSLTAQTPLLDALAEARGLTKPDLASRIVAKADLFATFSGQLIGKRQGLEDVLDALPETATAEDVDAVVWQ